MNPFFHAIQELRSVSIPDYEERIQDVCQELDDDTNEEGAWPVDFFPELLSLLSDSRFLSVRTSWHVLRFINNNRNLISPEQSAALKSVLVDGYDKFGDWMGPFLASEMLGQLYPNEETLRIFARLSKTASSPASELIPHGLEMLVGSTEDETLRRLVIHELEELRASGSAHVRREAEISLEKIKKSSP